MNGQSNAVSMVMALALVSGCGGNGLVGGNGGAGGDAGSHDGAARHEDAGPRDDPRDGADARDDAGAHDDAAAHDADASSNADTGPDSSGCCPPDSVMSGCMHIGGYSAAGCFVTCDFFCSTNWRIENDAHGCPVWRYDIRAPLPDENPACFMCTTGSLGCALPDAGARGADAHGAAADSSGG